MTVRAVIAAVTIAALVGVGVPMQTSFTFDGIRYTFYPGEQARTWAEAKLYCQSQGKTLAVFENRGQILNVSEYLSEDGGVWTAYQTDKSGQFEVAIPDMPPWKKTFGLANAPDADPSQCGLLSVAGNVTGIRPADCHTKKAALCALVDPVAVRAEGIRDGDIPVPDFISSSNPNAKQTPPEQPSRAPVVPPKSVIPPSRSSASGSPSSSSSTSSSGSKPKKAVSSQGKSPSGSKPAALSSSSSRSGSSSSSSSSSSATSSDDKSKSKDPIEVTVQGTRFVFFPNAVLFGGWTEASRVCEGHGMQAAVFKSRSQMEKVVDATTKGSVPVWTGYSSDGMGAMHSIDERRGPWSDDMATATSLPKQAFMCGLLGIGAADKRPGISQVPCSSPRMALCSSRN
ncbi:unnamed protein product (mitochondrion) [Plasmodiophora brassicae]|uniref:C-type lectin domain-containing protein n=1 Tax=Plasmodiophora brassicae TaxID=37360 RepID=A0A0G4IRC9_PLABS|nr:hypothetical protein PBRA_000991 [Plasmodiophora brassicae]SPQ97942.1 unnamed protein product [Plasmodiophora brassicae]